MWPMWIRRLYWRITWILEVLQLFRHRVTTEGFEAQLRQRLDHREQNFLWSAEHLVFNNPGSPYRALLALAGYDLSALRQLVLSRGLEAALDQLAVDGVYVRVQEFKGTAPCGRRGHTLRFQPQDFANPLTRGVLHTQSSGSRSGGTRTDISTEDFLDHARLRRWMFEQYGIPDRDVVLWNTPISGRNSTIRYTVQGRPPLRWYSLVEPGDAAALRILIWLARLVTRQPVPLPEVMPASRVLDLARAISQLDAPRGLLVNAFVNPALRLVLAAAEAGITLGDVAFVVGGEPLTPLKRRQFEERGYKVYSAFGFTELGSAAYACPVGREADDLHVLTERIAVRQYGRPVDGDGQTVPAYLFTTLLPEARNVMINMESGDYGGLEERRCGCFMDRLGLHLHMHTIRSFEKLTAEGMTFVGPALIALLEETLPQEFGGDSRHYQLVEAEDGQGFTRLYLLASPQLGPLDEEALRRTVLRAISEHHLSPGTGRLIRGVWEGADTIHVLRRDSLTTATGKVLHLHRDRGVLRSGNGQPHGEGGVS